MLIHLLKLQLNVSVLFSPDPYDSMMRCACDKQAVSGASSVIQPQTGARKDSGSRFSSCQMVSNTTTEDS